MKVVNVNIYDIIELSFDPVYMVWQQLDDNEEILIEKYTIRKTDKFYKIKMETCMNIIERGVLSCSKQFDIFNLC